MKLIDSLTLEEIYDIDAIFKLKLQGDIEFTFYYTPLFEWFNDKDQIIFTPASEIPFDAEDQPSTHIPIFEGVWNAFESEFKSSEFYTDEELETFVSLVKEVEVDLYIPQHGNKTIIADVYRQPMPLEDLRDLLEKLEKRIEHICMYTEV